MSIKKQLLHEVKAERPNPQYAVLMQGQLGGGNGEVKATMQYLSQSFRIKYPEIKAMIETHLPVHVQDYNMKVKFVKEATAPTEKLNVPVLSKVLQDFTKAPVATIPVTPRTDVQQLNDREIATGYLLTLKRAGREYAWSAMEASNPELREFLKDAFTMSCNHAYEVWQWMVKSGFYALSPAPQTEIDATGAIFNIVPQ